jgi:hypothetical protein
MSNFRQARLDDIPKIESLLAEFYAKQGHIYQVPYDRNSCLRTVTETVLNGVALVGPSSCAAAMILPFPYNSDAHVATVVYWYFKSAREIRILESLRMDCMELGATHFSVASHPPHHRIARHYEKLVLSPVETWSMGHIWPV